MSTEPVFEEIKAKVPEVTEVVNDALDNAIPGTEVESDTPVVEAKSEPEVPEKFKDKSREEVIQSFVELEKMVGKQGNELGELRRLADDYIKKDSVAPVQRENANYTTEDNEDYDIYSNPDKFIANKLREQLAPVQGELLQLRADKLKTQLKEAHPDYEEVFADENFQNWVADSKFRVEMFVEADQNYSYDAAKELFDTYKAVHGTSSKTASMAQPSEETARAATMETRDNAIDVTPKKMYRRADIIQLMQSNPQRYKALENEILQAYAEHRVI
jgi:hypothetical protein